MENTTLTVTLDHSSNNGEKKFINISSTVQDKAVMAQIMKLANLPIPTELNIPETLVDEKDMDESTQMIPMQSKYEFNLPSKKQAMMKQNRVNNSGDNPLKMFRSLIDQLQESAEDTDHAFIIDVVLQGFDVGDFLKKMGDEIMWDSSKKTIISDDFNNYSDVFLVDLIKEYLENKSNSYNVHTTSVSISDGIAEDVFNKIVGPYLLEHGYVFKEPSEQKKTLSIGE